MRDDEAGPSAQQHGQRLLQSHFRLRIDAAGRLVENQQARIGQQRPGEANHLPFAVRQLAPALADECVEPLRQRLDQIQAIESAANVPQFVGRGIGLGEPDVVRHGPHEQEVLLQHQTELPVQRLALQTVQVPTVDQHPAAGRQIKLGEQVDDRRLAASRVTDQRDCLSRPGHKTDVMQHRPARIVLEGDVLEFDPSLQACDGLGIRRVLPFGLAIQQREQPLGPRHRRHRLIVLVAENRQRGEEHIGHEEEADQFPHVGCRALRQHPPTADDQQQRDEDLRVQFHQWQEQSVSAHHRGVVARVIGDEIRKQAGVLLLPHKPLRHADADHRLGQCRRHPAE